MTFTLDEAPEFARTALDALRQPLESGQVVIARANQQVTYPARFQLVLAANPCPCGHGHGKGRDCTCTPVQKRSYLTRLSGPLLDRVDLHLTVQPLSRAALAAPRGESTALVAARVREARSRAIHRLQPWGLASSSEVPGSLLRSALSPAREHLRLLDRALDTGALTLRGYDRVLRVAWTLCDLAGRPRPAMDDIALALGLRSAQGVAA